MTGTIPQAAPTTPTRTWMLLVIVLGLHAVSAAAQPMLAGAYLSGSVDAIDLHSIAGSSLVLVSLVQGVLAVLFWRRGGGPGWPALATVALLLAESVQLAMGYVRILAVHVPLGVAIVGTAVAMFWWSLLWRPAS